MRRPETRHRARYHIMNYLMAGCVTHLNTGGRPYTVGGEEDAFIGGSFTGMQPPIGALVKLGSAPASKWYLGWLVEYQASGQLGGRYLIESIEDGTKCWWSNVDVRWLSMKVVDRCPHWKWTDRQFTFNDLWEKACQHEYLRVPMQVEFAPNGTATVALREKWTDPVVKMTKTFYNWRSVRLKDLKAFVDEAVANWPKPKAPPSLGAAKT